MPPPLSPVRRIASLSCALAVLVTVLAGAVLVRPATAAAEEPFRLADYVTDTAQALDGGRRDSVRAAVNELYTAHRERLWIVYVHDFADLDPQTWGERTAAASGFGDRDLLLAVAVTDRAYAVSGALPPSVDDAELDALLRDRVEPRLRDAQWAAAGVAAAQGLSAAMSGSAGPSLWPLLAVAALAVAAVGLILLYGRFRRRARDRAALSAARRVDPTDTAALAAVPPDLLDTRAREILVDLDDAIRTSAEELRLATDEFGATTTAPFTAALDAAKQALAQAFSIRQRLDDDIPETPDERRDLLVELISRCGRADRELDAKVAEFDAMRDLLINAPERLDALTRDVVDLTARVPASEAALAQLVRDHPASVLAPVRDNVSMARERIAYAERAIDEGRAAVARPVGQQGSAVAAIRSAESAVAAGRALLDAVDTAATDIAEARTGLPGAIEELRRDLDTAATLSEPGGAPLQQAVAAARTALAAATESGETDPLGTFQQAVAADAELDRAIAEATDRKLAADQLRRRLEQALTAATGQLHAAADYIATRRGGVDAPPRTRLAEAQRHLERAQQLTGTDPEQALQHARRAADLATRALHAAQASVREWQARQPVSSSSQAGAVLGGILIDGLLRGAGAEYRRASGGWGPGSFGGSDSSRRISRGGRF
ncbi:TPM domain-containing protein [Nocardia transvalensis]|uniref:TPM domain-containing protein n=1 Tax=Nocardia transvalensis TaxID=37333 RepID=UPI00189476EA|nr:TPM domain-containing protein [Nocardia transvalensis]MBF6331706.1 TPM domain-containing protein [Nocardia transvalensis]